ncbi:MAG: metallo-beta-lactamase family protein [Bacteroidia bacterium]|jgi:metallo-beta-lactamase family protein
MGYKKGFLCSLIMKLSFLGAARQVTGSMYLLQTESNFNILIDCGLNYEKGVPREENANFVFDPSEIDVVVLTHAHIDHSGNLPTLFASGFEGRVFCTEPTAALVDILLADSANIEAKRVNRKRKKKEVTRRLFGHKQVMDVMDNIVTMPFNKPFELESKVTVEFVPAGHILGAASIVFKIKEKKQTKTIGFTGDLGKSDAKVVVQPRPMKDLDYLVMEGTYGARFHVEERSPEATLMEYIQKTCIDQPGRLIIPAFSVGRTQAILFTLNQIFRSNKIKPIRVFTDSPLGINSGEIHENHLSYLNQEAIDFVSEYKNLFRFPFLDIVEDKSDEDDMLRYYEPSIIVSSAGMLEGGRIQRHIANNIQNPQCTILIAGYCTPGTLGATLLEGRQSVRVNKQERQVYAKIARTDVFSAHPDQKELVSYFKSVQSNSKLKHVFLSHGEESSLLEFKDVLSTDYQDIDVPELNQTYDL